MQQKYVSFPPGNQAGIFILAGSEFSDFILPFLWPYMGVIPNPKMAFIFPIS